MFTQEVVFATPPLALINAIFLNHSPQVRPSRKANHTIKRWGKWAPSGNPTLGVCSRYQAGSG
jgi:hypothetical protein